MTNPDLLPLLLLGNFMLLAATVIGGLATNALYCIANQLKRIADAKEGGGESR